MWARVVEIMLGCWLAISPLVFRASAADAGLWAMDLAAAALVITLAVVSYLPKLVHAHLAILAVAAWLATAAYLAPGSPPPPTAQNHLMVALLLAMFALVPSDASKPPRRWRAETPL